MVSMTCALSSVAPWFLMGGSQISGSGAKIDPVVYLQLLSLLWMDGGREGGADTVQVFIYRPSGSGCGFIPSLFFPVCIQ